MKNINWFKVVQKCIDLLPQVMIWLISKKLYALKRIIKLQKTMNIPKKVTKRLLRNVKEETRTEEYKLRPQKNLLQKKKSTIIANYNNCIYKSIG